MSTQDEDSRVLVLEESLERQRRRASFSAWLMLSLAIILLVIGVCIGLGNTSGELEGGYAGFTLKKLRGPIPVVLWVPTIFFCFRQFRRDRERAKQLEDRQNRELFLRICNESHLSTEDAIRMFEDGAGPKTAPEKQLPDGVILRVLSHEPAMKRVRSSSRRGLPSSLKSDDSQTK